VRQICRSALLAAAARSGQDAVVAASPERPQALGVDHVGLSVTDLDRATAFYCDVLGAQLLFGAHDAGSFRRVVVRLGSWMVDINQFHANDGTAFDVTRTGLDHLGLKAPSREVLEDWARWLDANGVDRSPIREMPPPMEGAMFDFVDPDGIQLEFSYVET
jgi:glyoxylase I family protein